MDIEKIAEMEDGKEKQLMEILADGGKPYVRKHDGFAVKVTEDKELTYKDHNDTELTMKVPEGSYVVSKGDGCYPEIVTADEFESNNKFVESSSPKKEKKKKSEPKIGMESIID